jgi:hypothetical protein
MKNNSDRDLLTELFGQIERAWVDRHDRMLVYELSEKYPEFRDQLYEFFEDIVLGPSEEVSSEMEEAEERVHHWLQSSGLDIAKAAAAQEWAMRMPSDQTSSPTEASIDSGAAVEKAVTGQRKTETFLMFLRRRLGQRLPELAKSLPNVTTEYLVLVSRHPNLVPERVKQAFAQYVEERWRIPIKESFAYLAGEPTVLRAASRSQPFEKEPSNFQELLERAKLNAEQKTFWLELTK